MAILNPEHLLEQAERLIVVTSAGRPRQADLRRAISSAYYAVFHATINRAADEFVGAVSRGSRNFGLVMRSIDHKTIKNACIEITKTSPVAAYAQYLPAGGFDHDITAFAAAFPVLQQQRHAADYDSVRSFTTFDARGVIAMARTAIMRLDTAQPDHRKALLFLLLFPPRR